MLLVWHDILVFRYGPPQVAMSLCMGRSEKVEGVLKKAVQVFIHFFGMLHGLVWSP